MPPTPPPTAERRAAYAAELARGTDRFHEPRRDDCPWCGSTRLRTRLRTPDLRRRRPGTFVVDECGDCAHAFQNPRLTPEGLAFHQRDPREGVPDGLAERLLAARGGAGHHRSAARAMLPFGEPESWLDVGTGLGCFPAAAKEVHPYTSFDGLDPTRRVERARAAGRVEEAHVGRLTDGPVATRLRARYDVVSMFHHLEHSPEPREELRAALAVLRPGGHLLVEVPDPDCAFGALLGKWWPAYGQPHHLHLVPLPNLLGELEALGCVVVATDRRAPHVPHDLSGALALALGRALPGPDAPWRPAPPTPLQRTARRALGRAAAPLLASTAGAERLLAPLLRRTRFSNAYRVIARKEP
ncbi:class I SAM-dependent methyltransferase [Streptomyces aureus]|uniref:class I SAM-dependent methyltransferase n=1 Tax=Streptomyces aureus TaxID=193461 RepID=UPI000567D598|nr:class I SAM-dependent methyltransferase [Streptomyces aureus]